MAVGGLRDTRFRLLPDGLCLLLEISQLAAELLRWHGDAGGSERAILEIGGVRRGWVVRRGGMAHRKAGAGQGIEERAKRSDMWKRRIGSVGTIRINGGTPCGCSNAFLPAKRPKDSQLIPQTHHFYCKGTRTVYRERGTVTAWPLDPRTCVLLFSTPALPLLLFVDIGLVGDVDGSGSHPGRRGGLSVSEGDIGAVGS